MVNQGAKILEESKAIRASDFDVMWENGYRWPIYRSRPIWWGEKEIAFAKVLEKMRE